MPFRIFALQAFQDRGFELGISQLSKLEVALAIDVTLLADVECASRRSRCLIVMGLPRD